MVNVNLHVVLLVVAAICFLLGAVGVNARVNLVSLGLFCWILTLLI